jgi:hypothetical protein
MGVGGQRHAPAALPLRMTWYPLYRKLGRPQGRYGLVLKISPPPGFDPRTVQLVASRYTDCAIPAPTTSPIHENIKHWGCLRTCCWVACLHLNWGSNITDKKTSKATHLHASKVHGRVKVWLHSALDGSWWLATQRGHLTPEESVPASIA